MTILKESLPKNTALAGEQDDHMRETRQTVADLLKIGMILAESDAGGVDDGQLKFGERVNTEESATGAITLDITAGTIHILELTGDVSGLTFSDPPDNGKGSPVDGYGFVLVLKQDATVGNKDVVITNTVKWVGNESMYQNTTALWETHYSFWTYDAGTTWFGAVIGDFYNV